ncbi:MAG: FKBP-type peptidyl-prolyl cis-trans isomerase [Deltaproteobacteria bacterium]|nr:FKBP-type peptidyl-prolyl cis-trans isomerase [Deltaproteobacteria bacterium]
MKVEAGKIITLEYTITTQKGELIESSAGRGGPLVFAYGKSGLLAGMDEQIKDMEENEEKEFDLPPEKAFGTIDSGPTMTMSKTKFPAGAETKVGASFEADLPGTTQTVRFVVIEDHVNDVLVRLIHPLAGKTIHIKATVVSVRDATPEDLQ